jgi:hypothetical protein
MTERDNYDRAKAELDQAIAKVNDTLTSDVEEPIKRRAVEIVAREGADAEDALERAITEFYHEFDHAAEPQAAGDFIPFWEANDAGGGAGERSSGAPEGGGAGQFGDQGQSLGDGKGARSAGGAAGEPSQDLEKLPAPEIAQAQAAATPEPDARIASDPETDALHAAVAARLETADMTVNIDGEEKSARAVLAELDQDREFLDSVKGCLS